MQLPQVVGIAVGVSLIGLGVVLRKAFVKWNKNVAGGVWLSIFAFLGTLLLLQNAVFSYASTWSWEGVMYYWAGMFGQALVPILFALLGLLYSPNRVAGYAVVLVTTTCLMIFGNG